VKLQGNITSVADIGGELAIEAQVCEVTAPDGTWLKKIAFTIIDRRGAAQTYYVGRNITVTVEPDR
jgi:hypothetical protein